MPERKTPATSPRLTDAEIIAQQQHLALLGPINGLRDNLRTRNDFLELRRRRKIATGGCLLTAIGLGTGALGLVLRAYTSTLLPSSAILLGMAANVVNQ